MTIIDKTLIITILLLVSIQYTLATTLCEFDFVINKNDSVGLHKINSFIGNLEEYSINKSDYILFFKDSANNVIEKINLPVVFYIFDAPDGDKVDSIPLSLRKTCDARWNKLEIFHNNKLIFSSPVKELICNNDKSCNHYETYLTCPSDCTSGSKDGWCDRKQDGICDPDCLVDRDSDCKVAKKVISEKTQPSKINFNSAYIILILIIIGFLIYIWKKLIYDKRL